MKVSKVFNLRMVELDIKGVKELSNKAGVSYEIALRIMKDQSSARFVDVRSIADCLGLKLEFIKDNK
ncbi:MAG TPA: hypothetical protein EYN54_06490 [Methylococcaceae bacterium]|nr:hypothetical protein [Methylococcaceae bacterium]